MKKLMTTACLFIVTTVAIVSFIAPAVFGQEKKTAKVEGSELVTSPAPSSRNPQSQPLVFTHVTVIDVAARNPRRALRLDQTVIINGDRISAVGRTGRLRIPESARVIDATGKFLVPGLWDMHVQMFSGEWETQSILNLFLANGVTGVRDMGSDLERIVALRQQIASGSLLGPRMVVAGPALDGQRGPNDKNPRAVRDAEQARSTVRRLKEAGVDFVKLYSYLSPEAFFAAIDEAKKHGLSAVGHVPWGVKASDAAKAGFKSIEHVEGVAIESSDVEGALREEIAARLREGKRISVPEIEVDQGPRYRDSYNPQRQQRLNAVFVKYHTYHCPTLVVSDFSNLGAYATNGFDEFPYRRYVPKAMHADVKRHLSHNWSDDAQSDPKVYTANKLALVIAMHRAGVRLLSGTDTPLFYLVPGFSMHDELVLLGQAGLSPLEVLQAATINPARFFGREKGLGTIERGKLADLILLDANPLDDIGNTRRINAVIANGTYLKKEALQGMLATVEAEARKESFVDMLLKTTVEQDVAAAIKQYRELKANEPTAYDFREKVLNTLGYRLLRMKRLREAIEIFKLNVEMYPDASNPYDSLGEAYLALGDTALAIKNYKRSVELNPKNTGGIEALKKLGVVP